jgi:glycosyltransferase involved in cell wall biosynthesis
MGDPLRILHAVVNMNRGGAETLLMNLYRNIDRSKVQFDFLTCKAGAFDAEIEAMGGKIHRITYVTEVGHTKYIKALDQFFFSHPQYKILHSHMDKMSGFVLRSAKKAGIPVRIAHSHSTKSEGGFAARLYKWYAGRGILPNTTHFLACSRRAAKWLFEKKTDQTIILKNGIESDKFSFSSAVRNLVREELKLEKDNYVIGHVGRFNHPKNHTFLLDIFAQLEKEHPNSVLVLTGDGPLRSDIEKKARDLRLIEKVKFLGVRNDITRLLQGFDVFVFPSRHEGMPVTLIEAQGAGLPCLVSNVITEEVDLGFKLVEFLPLNDKLTWVKKIKSLMAKDASRQISAFSSMSKEYDIKFTSEWAEGFYLAASGDYL